MVDIPTIVFLPSSLAILLFGDSFSSSAYNKRSPAIVYEFIITQFKSKCCIFHVSYFTPDSRMKGENKSNSLTTITPNFGQISTSSHKLQIVKSFIETTIFSSFTKRFSQTFALATESVCNFFRFLP